MARRRRPGRPRATSPTDREKYWRAVIAKQRRSGLTHTEFCRKESLSANTYFWWKRELGFRDQRRRRTSASPSSRLVAVSLRPAASPASGSRFEVVLASGRVVRVPADFDPASLKRLIATLEEEAC